MATLTAILAPIRDSSASSESPTMLERVPAQSVIEDVLGDRRSCRDRSRTERLFGRGPLDAELRGRLADAAAERAVARELADLPDGWVVLHSLPAGRGGDDIDHLVIGPGGILTITAARLRLPSSARAEAGARRVERILAAAGPEGRAVQPVVAVVGRRPVPTSGRVPAVRGTRLHRWLLRRPIRLDADEVRATALLLAKPEHWRDAAVAEPELLVRFGEVNRAERVAARARRVWLAAAALLLAAPLLPALLTR